MSLYKDYRCSPRLLDTIRNLLEQASPSALIAFARSYPGFQNGGFMIRPGKTAPIIGRILQLVSSEEPVDSSLLRFLAKNNGASTVLSSLSSDFISDHLIPLNRAYGEEPILLARLLDSRKKLRETALKESQPEDAPSWTAEEREIRRTEALATLREDLSPAFAALGVITDGAAPNLRDVRDAGELKELRAEVKRLRGAETRQQSEEKKRKDAEAARDEFQKQAEKLDAEVHVLRQRVEKAEADQRHFAALVEQHTEARLQQRLADEFSKWMGGRYIEEIREMLPSVSEEGREAPPSGIEAHQRLISTAKEALEKQNRIDAMSGVRDVLEERLREIQILLRRSIDAHANAIRPTKELEESIKSLRQEEERLNRILHPTAPKAAVAPVEALADAINAAKERELPGWTHVANAMEAIGILSEEERGHVEAVIRRRYALLGLANVEFAFGENGDPQTPSGIFRHALLGRRPLLLLLDAHNILFAMQSRYLSPSDHRFPGAKAREWLIDDMVQMTLAAPNCRVFVVFDGPVRSEATPAPNVHVIYSGGEGEHRADNVLIDEAEFLLEHGANESVILVTNDNGLMGRASRLGILNLPPTALLEFLR